jgi:hypothetical protein
MRSMGRRSHTGCSRRRGLRSSCVIPYRLIGSIASVFDLFAECFSNLNFVCHSESVTYLRGSSHCEMAGIFLSGKTETDSVYYAHKVSHDLSTSTLITQL